MELKRMSGVLAHPTSFSSRFGIGDMGRGAVEFIDFLYKGKQKIWQILPLNPTGFGDSPYQSFSTNACNELLIDPVQLVEEGWLDAEDIAAPPDFTDYVDYGPVITYKQGLYSKAFSRFDDGGGSPEFRAFCDENEHWLADYALFMALKSHFIEERRSSVNSQEYLAYKQKNAAFFATEEQALDYYHGAVWNSWPDDLASRREPALEAWREKLHTEIEYVKFLQFVFIKQWEKLKSYANERGVSIIGDLPIFVAFDSADLWANMELFHMNGLNPAAVAGVPPDYFSETGQLWGNPLYNWKEHAKTGFEWWINRLEKSLTLVDVVRVDHFRGFEAYWSIPYGAKNAVKGSWIKAPGDALFRAIKNRLGDAALIAEDLGVITAEVTALRKKYGFPGMVILQFGMEGGPTDTYLPHNFQDTDVVAYTGTHDNDTTKGWYKAANEKTRDYFRRLMNVSGEDPGWELTRLAFSSSAKWAVTPIQDVLGLGGEARMNMPGVKEGNWRFRFKSSDLTDARAEGLRYLAELFGRNEEEESEEVLEVPPQVLVSQK